MGRRIEKEPFPLVQIGDDLGEPVDCKEVLEALFFRLGVAPFQEHKFLAKHGWRIDYFFPGAKLGIEYEGFGLKGQAGGHRFLGGYLGDVDKYNAMTAEGILLIRITPVHFSRLKAGVYPNRALYSLFELLARNIEFIDIKKLEEMKPYFHFPVNRTKPKTKARRLKVVK